MNAYAMILTVAINGNVNFEESFIFDGWYQEKANCLVDAQKEQKRLYEMAGNTDRKFKCIPVGKKHWFDFYDKQD